METPFDRGEVDRASLEATERLRQRLAKERVRDRGASGRPRMLLPWAVAGLLGVFSMGLIANPWFEETVRGRILGETPPAPVTIAEVSALTARLKALEASKDGEAAPPSERLARTEAKVETSTDLLAREADRIDKLTADLAAVTALMEAERAREEVAVRAVTAAADRSEAVLAVMLARRAIEQGRQLGAIEAPLRHAFETRYPAAVRAVTQLGTAPMSTARLRRDLAALGPLEGERAGSGQSWWDVFSARVSRLVRPAGEADPDLRSSADAALARGDVAAAATQLRGLPAPRPAAVDRWLESADRLAAGEEALRQLEIAALLPPPTPTEEVATKPALRAAAPR